MSKATVAASLICATAFTYANDVVNQSAFNKKVTVSQVQNLKDDTNVELKGYIVKSIGDEKYQFKDQTGSITVDIDDELWQGKPISAKTPITIIGEIDVDYKPMKRVEIDVKAIQFN